MANERSHISVSKPTYDKLVAASKRLGVPIGVLVELAVSKEVGAPLSKQAQHHAERIAGLKPSTRDTKAE